MAKLKVLNSWRGRLRRVDCALFHDAQIFYLGDRPSVLGNRSKEAYVVICPRCAIYEELQPAVPPAAPSSDVNDGVEAARKAKNSD